MIFMRMLRIMRCFVPCIVAILTPAVSLADDGLVLATFGGHPITAADLIKKADDRNLIRLQPVTDAALAGELLDDVIIDSLIWREAKRISLAGEYGFWAQVRRDLTAAAAAVYQKEVLASRLALDSAQLEAYYRGHLARYMVPHEQRFVRNITIYYPLEKVPKIYAGQPDSLYQGWNPQAVIEALYARLADGEDFGILAEAHSEEPRTKGNRGSVGWVSKESLPDDEFGRMCLQIPLYQISKPFTSRIGWHIVQATGIRAPGPAPIDGFILNDIKSALFDSLGKQLANRIVDSLKRAATFVIFDKTLERPDSTFQPNTALAVINGRDTILAAEYLETVARLRARNKPVPSALGAKRELLEGMFPGLCMYRAMQTMGYIDRPEVAARRDEIVRGRVESLLRAQFVDDTYVPDSAEVRRYYNEHLAQYTRPQSYMVFYLRFEDREMSQSAASAWKTGATPDSVESRWVENGDVPDAIWKALTQMKENSVEGPLVGNGEYWVVQMLQKSAPRAFAELAPGIRSKLQESRNDARRESWMNKTGERYGVVRYPERLSRITLPPSKARKPLAQPGTEEANRPAGT
jgi:hypothetical protein